MLRSSLLCLLLALAACNRDEIPDVPGRGLVSFDREAPAGAELFERPEWTVGDRFVYLRAEQLKLRFRVVEKTDDGYLLEEEDTGIQSRFDRELGDLGQTVPDDEKANNRNAPVDSQFHWPLWVGKKWQSHFQSISGDTEVGLPLLARYEVDAVEEIKTSAGTFRCLRIWRRTRPTLDDSYLERVAVAWYAPEVGYFVRRLDDSTLLELESYHRQ